MVRLCHSLSTHPDVGVFLICLICRTVLSSSWVSFRGNASICSCRLDLPIAEGEVKILLRHHLGLEPKGVSCTHQLNFNNYHLLARILSSILPPVLSSLFQSKPQVYLHTLFPGKELRQTSKPSCLLIWVSFCETFLQTRFLTFSHLSSHVF